MDSCNLNKMISALDETGGNYFHNVARSGSIALLKRVEPFLDETHRSLLTLRDDRGLQCTHIAARSNDGKMAVMMIEYLVRLGANIHIMEFVTEDTLLHLAVYTKNYELAEWLGQQPNYVTYIANNAENLTAYEIAVKNGDERMSMILQKYKADVPVIPSYQWRIKLEVSN